MKRGLLGTILDAIRVGRDHTALFRTNEKSTEGWQRVSKWAV